MNDQEKLTEADGLRVTILKLQSQLLDKDAELVNARRATLDAETRLFQQYVGTTYGNPGERVEIATDNSIVRKPVSA